MIKFIKKIYDEDIWFILPCFVSVSVMVILLDLNKSYLFSIQVPVDILSDRWRISVATSDKIKGHVNQNKIVNIVNLV